MRYRFTAPMLALLAAGACATAGTMQEDEGMMMEDEGMMMEGTTFNVTVEAVSQPGTLETDRAMGAVPLSPGVYAVFTGANPMFTVGQQANAGIERIAEDGFPGPPLPAGSASTMVANAANVKASGVFQSPGGPLGPALEPGSKASFTVTASPGDLLQIATMFVQSNDWFYAFQGAGLPLFNGSAPAGGDVTSRLVVYDAGTEADTPPGTGPNQKPAQDPMAMNVGPADPNNRIRPASEDGFPIPPAAAVIRVTVTPQ